MTTQIKDGTGSGHIAKVDEENRLHVDAKTELQKDHACEKGNGYNVNTGSINLTSANKSAVFYIKNNDATGKIMHIPKIVYIIGNSTGGTGDMTISILRNPTAGDIITNATNVSINQNRNYGSNNTLVADIYKGQEGDAFTDGAVAVSTIYASAGFRGVIDVGEIILPKGASLGVEITPQSSNTSMNIMIAAEIYLDDED